jgi:hypothetical protein
MWGKTTTEVSPIDRFMALVNQVIERSRLEYRVASTDYRMAVLKRMREELAELQMTFRMLTGQELHIPMGALQLG